MTDEERKRAVVKRVQGVIISDPWRELRSFTDARIGLGRCGVSLPVSEWLQFRLAHARARDAVASSFDMSKIVTSLEQKGFVCLTACSGAPELGTFLMRPDLGRRLDAASRTKLEEWSSAHLKPGREPDMALVVSNGLSARAIHENAVPFVTCFAPMAETMGMTLAPVVVVRNGRVAVADETACLLHARLACILVGERPGLSSPNSMGIYLTYNPFPGCTDEQRNCISNVRAGGLSHAEASRKLCYLAGEALRRKVSGVLLKDDMPADYLPCAGHKAAPEA